MGELTNEQLPVNLGISEEDFLKDAEDNRPFERDETIIPFLRVLQPLSPTVQEEHPNYVPGAKAGMFYNLSNEMIYNGKDGITLVPITHQKNYTEWTPISKGGGFVRDWGESLDWQKNCDRDQINAYRPVTRDGTEIVYSIFMFVMIVDKDEGTFDPVIMPFSGTQIKKVRKWASAMINSKEMTSQGPKMAPYHFYAYHATTIGERNEKGSWYGTKVVPLLSPETSRRVRTIDLKNGVGLYQAARAFKQSLNEGTIRAAAPDVAFDGDARGVENEEEVPF